MRGRPECRCHRGHERWRRDRGWHCRRLPCIVFGASGIATAQDQSAAAAAAPASAQAPEPLSDDEMEVLVARIALYPDELVALISGAALFPLQIVEAERFLEDYAKDKNLKPKESWDGSVISLLNWRPRGPSR